MKKTSTVIKEKNTYKINALINNTAYIESVTGKSGLLDIRTNQIIGKMDNYTTFYDTRNGFYTQTKEIEKPNMKNARDYTYTIRIYDALQENLIVDNWEIIKSFEFHCNIVALKSPIDNKIHLFDRDTFRKSTNIFNIPLDNVEEFYEHYNEKYLIVSQNQKKGIYKKCEGLTAQIEFDDIELMYNIIVYTKNNGKYFMYKDERNGEKISDKFDTIMVDKNNHNIAYCTKDNMTYVYNTYSQELLLQIDCDEIDYIYNNSQFNDVDATNGEFFFRIKKDEKYGLISAKIDGTIRRKQGISIVSNLLPPIYDEIKKGKNNTNLYIKKNGKFGVFT